MLKILFFNNGSEKNYTEHVKISSCHVKRSVMTHDKLYKQSLCLSIHIGSIIKIDCDRKDNMST